VAGVFVLASRALAGWTSPSVALPIADLYLGSLVCLPLMGILQMALRPKPDMPHAAYVGCLFADRHFSPRLSFLSGDEMPVRTTIAAAIMWLIMIQLIASETDGYMAGRLRTKWAVHLHLGAQAERFLLSKPFRQVSSRTRRLRFAFRQTSLVR
jgi:hypothetical protein